MCQAGNAIAQQMMQGIFAIAESQLPIQEEVQGACEILGFDPLYVANEGRFVAFVPAHDAERALDMMRTYYASHNASGSPLKTDNAPCMIGSVTSKSIGVVTLKSRIGTQRMVDMLSGEQLPRIC
ncbi:hypothetical protein H6G89_27445 [Oscillatoria sp. FACHB-1407]|uniref:hypothetical protein n=1 Tax=Oscillatoria sp. FACHB-1407 TaxID=2692847 RepID=UPI001682C3F4|nr:hypothetical protein [Oscillatoria sp. FACHB-1407]MBD2464744.1 hypothetical protein [Oscillatoria sp. FACHB-1407]